MKCWPGCASSASTTRWYIVTARASATRLVSVRSAPVISSSSAKVLRKPHVSSGSVAFKRPADRPVAAADDLVHEALEEDRVARLVDLLRGQEVLLLLARRGVDERREVVGDGVLAVEEHRVVPQRRAALVLGHHLVPLAAVLGEVDLQRAPVAALPARVEIVVGDLRAGGHSAGTLHPRGSGLCARSSHAPRAARRGPRPATRSWVSVSRSRSVTVPSSNVWWSTVTANGVPISSWRR